MPHKTTTTPPQDRKPASRRTAYHLTPEAEAALKEAALRLPLRPDAIVDLAVRSWLRDNLPDLLP